MRKNDLKMILIGKHISFGSGKIDTKKVADIFQTIINTDLAKMIG